MGVLTGFYAIDEALFYRVIDEKLVTDLLDFLNFGEKKDRLKLPEDIQTPHISLDKGWGDISYLFRCLEPNDENFHVRHSYEFKYQPAYAFYWSAYWGLLTLQDYRKLCQTLFAREWSLIDVMIQDIEGVANFQLLNHKDFAESFSLLKAEILKRVTEKEYRGEFNRNPFNKFTTDYTFDNHFKYFMEFMMNNLLPEEGEVKNMVIIGLQS